jgi:CRISPR-associated protein Cst2
MSKHLFGLVSTAHGIAANNRADTEGNITTLQKILWNDDVHTTVSAEAIRWAIRYSWQRRGIPVNRVWNEEKNDHEWKDPDWVAWTSDSSKDTFIDDDVLGFMRADAAPLEANDAENNDGKSKRGRKKGKAITRRGILEVTRAISLTPFAGDITFNAKSGTKTSTSLYGTEVHATRYQYGFALTPESLRVPARAPKVLDAIAELGEVAGNQSRFLFDFSPESILLRWTDDMAPRFLYAFEADRDNRPSIPRVLALVQAGDIDPSELIVGGVVTRTADGERLAELGASLVDGVKAAVRMANDRVRTHLGIED